MVISEMRERIIFQRNTATKDKNGNRILSWEDVYSCAAYANNLSGTEYWAAAQTNSETDMYFVVRYCSELKNINSENYRIIFRDEAYNITFIDNVQYANKTIKIRVEKAVR